MFVVRTPARRRRRLAPVALAAALAVVSTAGLATAQTFDHLRCFKARDSVNADALSDIQALQNPPFDFPSSCEISVRSKEVCVPVAKTVVDAGNAGSADVVGQDLVHDYVCYKAKCSSKPTGPDTLDVADQFGSRAMSKFKFKKFCVPAFKPGCGDNVVDAGEECDDGVSNSDTQPDACRRDCTLPRCGDGVVDTGEDCDTGGTDTCDDGCDASCSTETPPQAIFTLTPRAGFGAGTTATFLENGWTGLGHGAGDMAEGRGLDLCANCTGSMSPYGVCTLEGLRHSQGRCSNDVAVSCSTVSGPDPACGGNDCEHLLFPPLQASAGNVPLCVLQKLDADLTGTFENESGDAELLTAVERVIHLGISNFQPCPVCSGDGTANDGSKDGTCVDGARDGLACDANGADATFGATSLDCPPSPGKRVDVNDPAALALTTASAPSLGFDHQCGTLFPIDCPCSVCTGDNRVGCATNADCTATDGSCSDENTVSCTANDDCSDADVGPCGSLLAGRCDGLLTLNCTGNDDCEGLDFGTCAESICGAPGGFGEGDGANDCDDFTCTPLGGGIGHCAAGPVDRFCDAVVRANGEGYVACLNNVDCEPATLGVDAGDCTLSRNRPCFPDPITATGSPDATAPVFVATRCVGESLSAGIDAALGLPGPERLTIEFDVTRAF